MTSESVALARQQEKDERDQWLAARKKGIGGSDAATLMGCNPWGSAFALYQDKISAVIDDRDNPAMFWGRMLERAVREAYCQILGREVTDGVTLAAHPEIPHMLVNTDGEIAPVDDHVGPGVYEGKTTSVFNAAAWDDDVPLYYQVQVQHALAVTGLQWGSAACLIMGKRDPFVWRDVERNDRFIETLEEAVDTFWRRHVVPRIPPPIDDSDATERTLKLLHPKDNGRVIILAPEATGWASERAAISKQMTEMDKRKKLLGNQLRNAIGDASYAEYEDGSGGLSCKHQFGAMSAKSVLEVIGKTLGDDVRAKVAAQAENSRPEFRSLRKAAVKTLATARKTMEADNGA